MNNINYFIREYNKRIIDIRVSTELKKLWAEKTLELTNIGAGATLFSQFVWEQQFSWLTIVIGLMLVIVGYVTSYLLYNK